MAAIEKAIKFENIHLHCRTCLRTLVGKRHNIEEMPTALVKILDYAGLEIPQTKSLFPNFICDHCYDIVYYFEELKMKIQEATKSLEELFQRANTKTATAEFDDLKQIEADLKQLEPDPLEENEDFEAVLVKLEIEMQPNSSGEDDETNKDEDDLVAINFTEEEDIKCESVSDSTNETVQLVCKYGCGKQFRRSHNAEAHYRFKHKNIEIKNKASQNFKLKDTINAQATGEETDTKIDSNTRTCNICFKNFATLGGLRSHMGTHGVERPFRCEQCNRGFNMKARLKRHIKEVHEENPPEIPCKYGCGKVFTRHESAMNHYRVKHILPEKGIVPKTNTYVCEDCGKTFKTMHNLKEHSYTHKPHTERPFQCDQCQKRFISKRPYEIHLLRHAGIKKFECTICGLKTTTHNELRNHMNHHTKAKQVNCPICSKTYTNPDNLRRHTLIVHQGVKNYKCRFCDEKFGKPDHLKHHEMRHTGERPHKCEICDRGFIQLVALKAHMKTHNKPPKLMEKVIG